MGEYKVKSVGILGAGVMGTGVAQKMAQCHYDVVLVDISNEILQKSLLTIKKNLMLNNMMKLSKFNVEETINKILLTTDCEELRDVDVVIENIPEKVDVKLNLYEKVSKICKQECIFMVNTSCIPISRIANALSFSDKVIGVHFLNPVPAQKISEVIKGNSTSEDTVVLTQEFLKSIDIESTVINDSPGFVTNRLSHLFMNEAANLVMEGIAEPEQIDLIFTKGFHHEMGPLHTADLIGIDTVVDSIDILYSYYHDSRYVCSPCLRKMVEKGELGIKSGKGFFIY
ncbi:3-hydroxyacyl-CoA dehydrogenase family protein [Lacrimispora algidixylanolytica]|uniref:3-hydroxybutyryl-CoA dehydrogenase n=1 Tax=Lacrimispora algidixylanolytica TaxID=94868 RepID=A0A419T1N7_9FIRM|nr:3-hydroxyacyl-CoA dehydrogenase family protein [Lacrimispora algidixylanolytica]RKD31349.1 hypothetical protein BET01_20750 [Lacrimispora algidixylanolytica]